MKYIIANWKARKTLNEGVTWVEILKKELAANSPAKNKIAANEIKIIIAPAYPFIHPLRQLIAEHPYISLASQDLSKYEERGFTGEVTAKMLQGAVEYALVGHSERRSNFGETNEDIRQKCDLAKAHGIEPVLCVRGEEDTVFEAARFIAYEPVSAIGTGNNESLENVLQMKQKILRQKEGKVFLYGGSVDTQSVSSYLQSPEIDGLLVGGASLDAVNFFQILSRI